MDLFGKDEIEKTAIEARKLLEQLQVTVVEARQTIQMAHSILNRVDRALKLVLKDEDNSTTRP